MFIDTGTGKGVSILYVSVQRCSKRWRSESDSSSDLFRLVGRKERANLELNGENGRKPLDREPFIGLLRDLVTFLTCPIFNSDIFRLDKPANNNNNVLSSACMHSPITFTMTTHRLRYPASVLCPGLRPRPREMSRHGSTVSLNALQRGQRTSLWSIPPNVLCTMQLHLRRVDPRALPVS